MAISGVVLIILIVLGVVVGNLLLLKHSAKMPFKGKSTTQENDDTAP